MIKLLLIIIISVLLYLLGVYTFSDKTQEIPGSINTPQYSKPADTIQGAGNAVQQTQDLQNRLNQKAADQLNQ